MVAWWMKGLCQTKTYAILCFNGPKWRNSLLDSRLATGQFKIGNQRPIFCAKFPLSVPAPTVNHIHLILTCWLGIPLLPLWLSYAFKLQ